MTEVFLVIQVKQHPLRELVVAVCASERRAERFVACERRPSSDYFIVRERVLPDSCDVSVKSPQVQLSTAAG